MFSRFEMSEKTQGAYQLKQAAAIKSELRNKRKQVLAFAGSVDYL